MTALTASRPAAHRAGGAFSYPVAAGAVCWAGGLAALTPDGAAVPAGTVAGERVVGVFAAEARGGATHGARTAQISRGIYRLNNSPTDPLTDAHVHHVCYVEDDATVSADSVDGTRASAGVVTALDAAGVWVDVGSEVGGGLALTPGAAGQAVLAAATIAEIQGLLGLDTAAYRAAADFATAAQGEAATATAAWGDHRSVGYAVVDAQGRLPAVSGELLTALPAPFAVYTDAAALVENATTPLTVIDVTPPAGVAPLNGATLHIATRGTYLNNTAVTAGFTLTIAVGGTTVYSDLYDAIPSAGGGREVRLLLDLVRTGAAAARLEGLIWVGTAVAATTGVGDGGFIGIRANALASETGGAVALTYDWAAPPAITATITLSSSTATHRFTRAGTRAFCAVYNRGAVAPPPVVPESTRAYFEDQPIRPAITRNYDIPIKDVVGWPQKASSTLQQNPGATGLGQMDLIIWKPFDSNIAAVAAAQAIRPTTYLRIIAGPAYQGFPEAVGEIRSGHNFDGSGPISGPGVVYPGHWLYLGGTVSAAEITATATTLSVDAVTYITAGKYCVIYDPGWGSFTNAEHVLVNSVTLNSGTGKYDLSIVRGYKSTAVAHPAGSCVAQHAQGNGVDSRLWRYNQSPDCPLDGAGKRWNQYFAEWIAAYYDAASYSTLLPCAVHGVNFDADFPCDPWGSATGNPWADRAIDPDNDGIADWGFSRVTGENRWRVGWNDFYQNCRDALDARGRVHAVLVAGESSAAGHGIVCAQEKEGAGSGQMSEAGSAAALPAEFDRFFSASQAHQAAQTQGPLKSNWMEKIGTLAYPPPASGGTPTGNHWARISFAIATILEEMYGWHNWRGADADRYYDEECVDLTPGANYGKSVAKTDAVGRRTWKNWLGAPTAPYWRVYSYDAFAPGNALLAAGFETDIAGWSASNAVLTRVTTTAMEGSASLRIAINPTNSLWQADSGCRVTGPTVSLAANTEYTLALSLRADRHGRVRPAFGSPLMAAGLYATPGQWARRIWTFRTSAAVTAALTLDVASFGAGDLFVDAIYLFAGNVDVFLRTFENGILVANVTPTAKTVALGGTYQRVLGTIDPINDGSSADTVTIAPYDAYVGVVPA